MALFYTKKQAEGLISQAVNAAKKRESIRETLGVQSLDRAKADVQKWRDALDDWENTSYRDRYEMMQLYQEIIQDDSIATHLTTIARRIEGTEFEVGRKTAEGFTVDEEKTALLNGAWFDAIIRIIIETEMMGFSLVDITPPEGQKYSLSNVNLIPRYLVVPEWGKVRTKPQTNIELIDYTQPIYSSRLLQIGGKEDKGLFNNMALLYIYKKNALAFWANYQSKFGIPPVIVKTDLGNTKKLDSLVEFLSEMRSNSFSLVGFDDEVSILSGVNTDAFKTFAELINHCDGQMAKVMQGQTMTSDDGSSRSQAEVHERTADFYHLARIWHVEQVINEQLFPILTQDGFNMAGLTFRYKEVKDVDAIINRAVLLKQAGYSINVDYLAELTGLPLEKIETPAPGKQEPPANIINAIDELYNHALGCC